MTTPLGIKRQCLHCNSRFYDLNKLPPTCPKCGQVCEIVTGKTTVRRKRRTATERFMDGGDLLTQHMAAIKSGKFKKTEQEEKEEFQELDATTQEETEELEADEPRADES